MLRKKKIRLFIHGKVWAYFRITKLPREIILGRVADNLIFEWWTVRASFLFRWFQFSFGDEEKTSNYYSFLELQRNFVFESWRKVKHRKSLRGVVRYFVFIMRVYVKIICTVLDKLWKINMICLNLCVKLHNWNFSYNLIYVYVPLNYQIAQ